MERALTGTNEIAVADPGVELFTAGVTRKLLAVATVTVVLYGAFLLYTDLGSLVANVRRVSLLTVVLALGLCLGNIALRVVRWRMYLRVLGLSVPATESTLVFLSGLAMSVTPAKVGELLKSLMLKESRDVAVARSAPIVVAERVTDLIGVVTCGAIGLFGIAGGIGPALLSLAGVLFLVASCAHPRPGKLAIAALTRIPRVARFRTKLDTAHDALLTFSSPGVLLRANLLSIAAWGLQCASVAIVAREFPGVAISFADSLVAYAAPLLAGTLSLVPGGVGLTEASMAGAVRALGGEAATPAVAAAITIVVRVASLWFAVAIGFAALVAWRRSRRAAV